MSHSQGCSVRHRLEVAGDKPAQTPQKHQFEAKTQTHRLIKDGWFDMTVPSKPPFDVQHAERELEHLRRSSTHVDWHSPEGSVFSLTVPPTVYPPREDTDLLAKVVSQQAAGRGQRWLEIGTGGGALSVYAASRGYKVTACDINPYAVASTRANLSLHGFVGEVHEGGPGPRLDGGKHQWGGHRSYDIVVWNLPYLPASEMEGERLGPMEEAALVDNDEVGLYSRFLQELRDGSLLAPGALALAVVSSKKDGDTACEQAWVQGLAASVCAIHVFESGEELAVVKVWKPYEHSMLRVEASVSSTNEVLLNEDSNEGTSLRALVQHQGRGQRGRSWTSTEGALLASWVVGQTAGRSFGTMDQVNVGAMLTRLLRFLGNGSSETVCLKWPNDVFVKDVAHQRWQKTAGVLFEGKTQGDDTRVVLGIGINTVHDASASFGGLDLLGLDVRPNDLHKMVHAMVASLYESARGRSNESSLSVAVLNEEVECGVKHLGPVFYRGVMQSVEGLGKDGILVLSKPRIECDDPNELRWSNVQIGVEHIVD